MSTCSYVTMFLRLLFFCDWACTNKAMRWKCRQNVYVNRGIYCKVCLFALHCGSIHLTNHTECWHCQEIAKQIHVDNRRHTPPGYRVQNIHYIETSVHKTYKQIFLNAFAMLGLHQMMITFPIGIDNTLDICFSNRPTLVNRCEQN